MAFIVSLCLYFFVWFICSPSLGVPPTKKRSTLVSLKKQPFFLTYLAILQLLSWISYAVLTRDTFTWGICITFSIVKWHLPHVNVSQVNTALVTIIIVNYFFLIRFLKRCLQCSENLQTLSSVAKNRWDECCAVGKVMVQAVEQHYSARRTQMETSDKRTWWLSKTRLVMSQCLT